MIRRDDVYKIGKLGKPHGVKGEISFAITDDVFDRVDAEYLVLDINGILVPFYMEEYRFKNDDTVIIKFEDIDNETHARQLVGHAVYYPKSHISQTDTDTSLSSYKALTGYTVYDHANQMIGTITHVDDSSANTLLTITTQDGKDLLIPYHDDFLINFDLRQRVLQLHIPQELLSLNDDGAN